MHRSSIALAVGILLCVSGGVSALCDVDLTGQALAAGSVITFSCPEATPTTMGYKVSGDVTLSVYFTDGSNCNRSPFDRYTDYSTENFAAGQTGKKLIPAVYASQWDGPCFRIKNVGATPATNLRIQISWFEIKFENQFHLLNTGQYYGVSGADVNAQTAWNAGATGSGIVVDICDDGLQSNHVEIAPRIRLDLSLNYENNKYNPTGSVDDTHGTGCGGVAAADGANSYCGKGAAYGAQLAGHRILGFASTNADFSGTHRMPNPPLPPPPPTLLISFDLVRSHAIFVAVCCVCADALYNANIPTDVSSNSWGPEGCINSGCIFYESTPAVDTAIRNGAASGREGRGKVYVFAAGNEFHYGGDANQYTETKLKEVMTIAGSGFEGKQVFYSNEGANVFVNSPTQGNDVDSTNPGIITAQGSTTSATECRDDFGGTSSSTPLVAGVIATILSANPKLHNRGPALLTRSLHLIESPV